ncbi:hypothetical protein Tco_0178795 [Tanacetum coccineum]
MKFKKKVAGNWARPSAMGGSGGSQPPATGHQGSFSICKCEHEEMEIFIKEFRTTNELLLKERSNLFSELKIEVNELSKVMSNVLIPKNKVKGVTTMGGKMTSEATRSKEINETRINKNEPSRFKQDVQEKSHDDGVKNKSSSIRERTTQSSVKPQQSSIPFPN